MNWRRAGFFAAVVVLFSVAGSEAEDTNKLADAKKLVQDLRKTSKEKLSPEKRLEAAESLGRAGIVTDDVINSLCDALADDEICWVDTAHVDGNMRAFHYVMEPATVAGAAAEALGKLGNRAKKGVPEMRRLMRETTRDIDRVKFAGAVASLDKKSDEAVKILVEYLDGADFCRAQAIDSLSRLGARAKPALPKLRQMSDEDRWYSLPARKAVSAIGEKPK